MKTNRLKGWKVPLFVAGGLYLAARPALDFSLGSDSPFSRYLARPLMSWMKDGAYETEQQFQEQLVSYRRQIANGGHPTIAKIVTFPFHPCYEDYKSVENEGGKQ